MSHFMMNILVLCILAWLSLAHAHGLHEGAEGKSGEQGWKKAHATFYGEYDGSGTDGSACGYQDTYGKVYGTQNAALSTALFLNGSTCGACFEIRCWGKTLWGDNACNKGNPSTIITGTNFCPPSDKPSDNGGWCNPPLQHFDMAQPAFRKIADWHAGIVPVQYRRVSCTRQGGLGFVMNGNPWFNLVLVYNVGGNGVVSAVSVKGSNIGWLPLTRNWGQNWQTNEMLVSQSLSFQVTTQDGKTVIANNVAPSNWNFGQSFKSHVQFN